jgi:hypothetical protein
MGLLISRNLPECFYEVIEEGCDIACSIADSIADSTADSIAKTMDMCLETNGVSEIESGATEIESGAIDADQIDSPSSPVTMIMDEFEHV